MAKFHKSTKWERKRLAILRRDKYMCRECRRYGRTTAAVLVHHIYPIEEYPELRLANENLISLCVKCHENMHDRTTGRLTEKGEHWQRKVGDLIV